MNTNSGTSFGALFDWDGVVIDSSAQHEKSWELLADEIGKPLPPDHFLKGFGMKNEVIIPRILGWSENPEDVQRLSLRKEALYRGIVRREGIAPLPGVARLVKTLRERGVPCAVASSTHRKNIETVLALIGLRDAFQALVTSEDVSHGKPDPEVFIESARRLQCDPGRCVVFEDAPVGIEAGLSAGAKVVAVTTSHPPESLRQAHLVVETLASLDWERVRGLFS